MVSRRPRSWAWRPRRRRGSVRSWRGDFQAAFGDLCGDLMQVAVVGSGVAAEEIECCVYGDSQALGEHPLGLLDDDPAGQRRLELRGDSSVIVDAALIGQANRCDDAQ